MDDEVQPPALVDLGLNFAAISLNQRVGDIAAERRGARAINREVGTLEYMIDFVGRGLRTGIADL